TAALNGFGPSAQQCSDPAGTWVTTAAPFSQTCPVGSTGATPLLLYLQGATGVTLAPATDAAGASDIANEDFALFVQDKWQLKPNFTFTYGLRWEAQTLPEMAVQPSATAYGPFLSDPRFPSNGKLPDQYGMIQPRVGFAWDIANNTKSVLRAS